MKCVLLQLQHRDSQVEGKRRRRRRNMFYCKTQIQDACQLSIDRSRSFFYLCGEPNPGSDGNVQTGTMSTEEHNENSREEAAVLMLS